MKIWLLRRRYNPAGGAERYTQRLAAWLHHRGHEVWIAAESWPDPSNEDYHLKRLPSNGLAAFARACSRHVVDPGDGLIFSLERTSRQHVFRAGDGVHSCWLKRRSRHQSSAARLWTSWSRKHQAILAMEKRVFTPEATDWILANSSLVRREILANSDYPAERIRVIHPGVDLTRFQACPDASRKNEVRRALRLPQDAVVWCFVGSGFERKGLLWAIQISAALRSQGVWLAVLGHGVRRRYLQAAAALQYEDRLCFMPEGTSSLDVYHASDAFILPTIYDPCSNATLEAAACGLPVITTEANGAVEWTRGVALADPSRTDECVEQCQIFARPLQPDPAGLQKIRAGLDENPCWDATLKLISEAGTSIHPALWEPPETTF